MGHRDLDQGGPALGPSLLPREGRPEESQAFVRLALESSPSFLPSLFGPRVEDVLARLYRERANLFSHENARFLEAESRILGLVLGYDGRTRTAQRTRTGWLLACLLRPGAIRLVVPFIRADSVLGRLRRNDFYVSNLAVVPEARGKGLGSRLLAEVERWAAAAGQSRIVLDAETDNEGAIRLYRRLGYVTESTSPCLRAGARAFRFHRMVKATSVLARPT